MTYLSFLLLSAVLLILHALKPFIQLILRQLRSPLRHLPGPSSPSFFIGNLAEMHDQENNDLVARWEARFGSVWTYRGFIGGCRLMTTDPVAIAYILGHAYDYPKPDFVRDSLATMSAGHEGLLTVEGEVHRRQRKILTPAFSTSHIKSLTPIFWDKALQLRDIWLAEADSAASSPLTSVPPFTSTPTPLTRYEPGPQSTRRPEREGEAGDGAARIDVLGWLGRATLDVIGLAGFGHTFNALTDDTDALAGAFGVIFSTARRFRVMTILQVWIPVLRRFRRNTGTMLEAQATMRRIGLAHIEERRREVEEEMAASGGGIDGNKTILGRDILSVLVRSNMTSKPSERMSIEEILCQISTFIAAGHETTGSALAWALYALARDPAVQTRLRAALRAIPAPISTSDYTMSNGSAALTEAVQKCEYLDWVVRESLRCHAPVTNTMRVCMRDADEIPVGRDGYVDRHGARRWGVRVQRGDIISVPIQAVNKSEAVWGADAGEFRPERWYNPPESVRAIPGLYSNMLTFLNGNPLDGNRACIGYKFALIEIKIFLYVLLKDIEFSIDPDMVIEKKVNVVTRPFVKSEPHLGNQMPLYVRRAPLGPPPSPPPSPSH